MGVRHAVAGAFLAGILTAAPARCDPAPDAVPDSLPVVRIRPSGAPPARAHRKRHRPAARAQARAPAGDAIRAGRYRLHPPCPLDNLMRGFKGCRRGRARHPAVDIGGVGPDCGLGTPVRAIVRARVTFVGRCDQDPSEFGQPDLGEGFTMRSGQKLPRAKEIPGYGTVRFFTRSKGRWRSGNVVSLVGLGGGLEGYAIRYMHLGAIRPDLKPGMVVEAGDELGVLGGTAVQDSLPHVHLDVTSPSGVALDMKSILTGDSPQPGCGRRTGAKHPLHHKPAAR